MPDLPRLGLLFGLLALAACGPPEMPPEAAMEAYQVALDQGDAERAVDLLEMAADGGDLAALRVLADAYERGYVQDLRYTRGSVTNLPIRTSSHKTVRARWRFERALREGADQDNEDALYAVAEGLLDRDFDEGTWHDPTDADRDSAASVLRRLDALGTAPFRRALLAQRLGDEAGFHSRLQEGVRAGDPTACMMLYWEESRDDTYSAEHISQSIDRSEACRALSPPERLDGFDHAGRTVATLREQVAVGNTEAGALLDSLARLGVFERHPRLSSASPGRP